MASDSPTSFRMSTILMVFAILISIVHVNRADFCDKLVDEQTELPCPKNFDILEELSRSDREFRLDFDSFKKQGISNTGHLYGEITKRLEKNTLCPYKRKVQKTVCCDNWQGPNCDERKCLFFFSERFVL